MTSLHVIYGLAPLNPKSWQRLCIKPCAMCRPDTCCCIFVLLHAPFRVVAYQIAKVHNIRCIASSLKNFWYGSTKRNMEENFIMEWNKERKIFIVWNGNGMEENCQYGIWKNHLPFHTTPWLLHALHFNRIDWLCLKQCCDVYCTRFVFEINLSPVSQFKETAFRSCSYPSSSILPTKPTCCNTYYLCPSRYASYLA